MDHGSARRIVLVLLAVLPALLRPAPAKADDDAGVVADGEFVAPPLVERGEPFEATLMRRTDAGTAPVREGETVVYRGRELAVGPRGRLELPAEDEAGNRFLDGNVSLPKAHATLRVPPAHVEVVTLGRDLPTRIDRTSRTIRPGGRITVLGQRLTRWKREGVLRGAENRRVDLGEPVYRSSLAESWDLPRELPAGRWRLFLLDEEGREHAAPTEASVPTLEVSNLEVEDLSRDGAFYVRSDTDASVVVTGGEPEIRALRKHLELVAGQAETVTYTPLRRGHVRVDVRPESPIDDPVPSDAPGVDAEARPVEARYDTKTDSMDVRTSIRVRDRAGSSLADRSVFVVLAHPRGLVYSRGRPDSEGLVSVTATLPYQASERDVEVHPWLVAGARWTKQDEGCLCTIKSVRVLKDPKDGDAKLPYVKPVSAYTAGAKSDSVKLTLPRIVVSVEAKGKAPKKVEIVASADVELSVIPPDPTNQKKPGDVKALAELEEAAWKAEKAHDDAAFKKATDKALKALNKLKLDRVDLEALQGATWTDSADCGDAGPIGTVTFAPVVTAEWKADKHRIGTPKASTPRRFLARISIKISCGHMNETVTNYWTAEIAWDDEGKNADKTNELFDAH